MVDFTEVAVSQFLMFLESTFIGYLQLLIITILGSHGKWIECLLTVRVFIIIIAVISRSRNLVFPFVYQIPNDW